MRENEIQIRIFSSAAIADSQPDATHVNIAGTYRGQWARGIDPLPLPRTVQLTHMRYGFMTPRPWE
jgi:hypothetical protein